MASIFSVSVRDLANNINMSGSIDTRYVSKGRMTEGTKIHKLLEKRYTDKDLSEVSIKCEYTNGDITFSVAGRIDGVLNYADSPIIEEIKSTHNNPDDCIEPDPSHLSQARVYAYMYAEQNNLKKIDVRITYYFVLSKSVKHFDYTYTFTEALDYFTRLCEDYLKIIRLKRDLRLMRDESVSGLAFPFEYRKNQRAIITRVYKAIQNRTNAFVCAPTGTGKTIDSIFPAVKILPDMSAEAKIFYLTARSPQKEIARETVALLMKNGLKAIALMITAKEKVCKLDKPSCNPDDCPYAKDYYDKLKKVTEEVISEHGLLTPEIIDFYAEKYTMCPFELSLDLSLFADIIICDYNYVFDPSAYLSRYFSEEANREEHVLLIDEAHNLVDRSRDMYSTELVKSDILKTRKALKGEKKLTKLLNEMNQVLLELSKREEEPVMLPSVPDELAASMNMFLFAADKFLSSCKIRDEKYTAAYEMYFTTIKFLNICALIGPSHYVFYDKAEKKLKVFCSDAQDYLRAILAERCVGGVFFSATLTPLSYYRELLGGNTDDMAFSVAGIFPPEHFKIAADVSIKTTYKQRDYFYGQIAERIHTVKESKRGNYIAYFPSYKFMQNVYESYVAAYSDESTMIQQGGMSEAERESFLAAFVPGSAITAFAVSGGVFSESVDLTGQRLIGAIICGVSLPMVCTERELIKQHFDEEEKNGFEYAYIIPGMNKVLQAMGRVIRTPDDVGVAVVMDERFRYPAYAKCFPAHYSQMQYLYGNEKLKSFLASDYE